ncbi:hypothetical protein G2W53_033864 [Senna tora]|uniref:Uncharacterized protein n=1 Tax=Senna tora TaxID=362788 RepID=A0A834SYC1_9FABA|nr:hypothetical protein G2W53_033864 [Senna tora]
MWSAAKATYPQEWKRVMLEINNVNESAYQHLKEIPPRFWTKSAFRPGPKCDELLNNMCETFNAIILKAREAHCDHKLEKEFQESGKWLPRWARKKKYEVKRLNRKSTVDLSRRECGCCKWMLTSIPFINPSDGPNLWPSTPYDDVLPPPYRKPIERSKMRGRKVDDEQTKKSNTTGEQNKKYNTKGEQTKKVSPNTKSCTTISRQPSFAEPLHPNPTIITCKEAYTTASTSKENSATPKTTANLAITTNPTIAATIRSFINLTCTQGTSVGGRLKMKAKHKQAQGEKQVAEE